MSWQTNSSTSTIVNWPEDTRGGLPNVWQAEEEPWCRSPSSHKPKELWGGRGAGKGREGKRQQASGLPAQPHPPPPPTTSSPSCARRKKLLSPVHLWQAAVGRRVKRKDSPVPKNCPFDLWRCDRSLAMNAPNTCIRTDGQTDRNTRQSTCCFSTGSELAHAPHSC